MQTIKPNKDYIFAKQVEAENKTKSGLYLVDNAIVDLKHAEVINVGSNVTEYSAGDVVLFKEYSTTETELDGVTYLLVMEEDVLGKIINTEEVK